MKRVIGLLLLAGWGVGPAALAEQPIEATTQELVVGRIDIVIGDIFDLDDPQEDSLPYRLANRLHRRTREHVVRDLILLRPGDRYSTSRLRESERLLRSQRFFHDAVIRLGAAHDGVVDLTIEARKSLAIEHSVDVDRTGTEFKYRDPALAGRHITLGLEWADNDDGNPWHVDLQKPFESLDGRLELSGRIAGGARIDHRYSRGEVVGSFRHVEDRFDVSVGLSDGLSKGRTVRWRYGLSYERHQYDLDPNPDPEWDTELFDPSGPRPQDREIVAPWIGFEYVEDAFAEVEHLDLIDRVEDRYTGKFFRARLGWSTRALGADRDRAIFDLKGSLTRDRGDDLRLGFLMSGHGRWGADGAEDLLVSASAEAYRRDFGEHIFYARLGVDLAHNLDADDQLLLGGRTGLRGFPLRYQDGDQRFLLTLEQRFYTDWRPLHLAAVGAAVFADVGRSWFRHGTELPDGGEGVLADLGVGLRLALSRTGRGHMLHVDVAFPIGGDPSIDGVQILVGTFETF